MKQPYAISFQWRLFSTAQTIVLWQLCERKYVINNVSIDKASALGLSQSQSKAPGRPKFFIVLFNLILKHVRYGMPVHIHPD
jgi:hypothetical protein